MQGWARMALSLNAFTIVEVAKPNIGERQPSRVRADVSVHLAVRDNIKMEWEQLRKHDVCFLHDIILGYRDPACLCPLCQYA